MTEKKGRGYPSDVSEEEWEFVVPYLTLMREDAGQRDDPRRERFNARRWMVRAGCPWRRLPNDFAPWSAVQQPSLRWQRAGVFEAMAQDLCAILRLAAGRQRARPSAVILDRRTLQGSPESGARAGDDGAKRRKGRKVHAAVDTLGHLLALRVSPANGGDRTRVGALAQAVPAATGGSVQLAWVDAGYTGDNPAQAAAAHGLTLEVVKLAEAKRGFVLLPRRWVIERTFGWAARFRRLARDYERRPETLAALHWLAFGCLLLRNLFSANLQNA